MPKSVKRFSDQIMRKTKRMMPKSVKRFSDQVMRQIERMMTLVRSSERLTLQTREA